MAPPLNAESPPGGNRRAWESVLWNGGSRNEITAAVGTTASAPNLWVEAAEIVTRATATGGGFYEPDPDGPLELLLLPVIDAEELLDIIGWPLGSPATWFWRLGAVDRLGEPHVEYCRRARRPLRVVGTPATWLQDRGECMCPLDWATAFDDLDGIPALAPETPALAKRIARALRRAAA